MVDQALLDMLVCPVSKTSLQLNEKNQELVSKVSGLAYPIRDGIPVLLEEEARPLNDDELTQL